MESARLIAALYDALAQLAPSPVVELNRAVAISMAFGPQAALEIVEALAEEQSLKAYHLLPSVQGDLLFKLGRYEEARSSSARQTSLAMRGKESCCMSAPASAPGCLRCSDEGCACSS